MSRPFQWTHLHPFGARVDLDLSREVSQAQIEALRELYDQHHLLFFPGQALAFDRQVIVSGWFGPTIPETAPAYLAPDPKVGGLGSSEIAFHSDLSCSPEPLLGISLHAVDVAREAPPTVYVDVVGTVARLPDRLRARVADLHVRNL
jgi:taurine dioxygenase